MQGRSNIKSARSLALVCCPFAMNSRPISIVFVHEKLFKVVTAVGSETQCQSSDSMLTDQPDKKIKGRVPRKI